MACCWVQPRCESIITTTSTHCACTGGVLHHIVLHCKALHTSILTHNRLEGSRLWLLFKIYITFKPMLVCGSGHYALLNCIFALDFFRICPVYVQILSPNQGDHSNCSKLKYICKFADDSKIGSIIRSESDVKDCRET